MEESERKGKYEYDDEVNQQMRKKRKTKGTTKFRVWEIKATWKKI